MSEFEDEDYRGFVQLMSGLSATIEVSNDMQKWMRYGEMEGSSISPFEITSFRYIRYTIQNRIIKTKRNKMNTAYSERDVKKVLKLRREGQTYASIAKKVGLSIGTVGNWLRDAIEKNPRKNKDLKAQSRKGK